MTYEEAINVLKMCENNCGDCLTCKEHDEAIVLAIEALEKQIPKMPKEEWSESPFSDDKGCLFQHLMCPNCGKMEVSQLDDFCPHCGQAIDWSDDEE